MSNIIKMLGIDEGRRSEVYLDTMGYRTVGIGFCVDKISIPGHIEADWSVIEGRDIPANPDDWPPMPDEIMDDWLEYLVELNRNLLQPYVHKYDIYLKLSQVRRDVIDDMCYQLGISGVCRFTKMWKFMNNGDYASAAVEMKDSSWHKQTTNRCERLSWMMENDKLHEYYK